MGQIKTKKYEIEWTVEEDGIVILHSMFVHDQYKGKGIATKMMQRFVNRFSHRDIELVANPLDDDTDLERLVNFYERFGFEQDADQCSESMTLMTRTASC